MDQDKDPAVASQSLMTMKRLDLSGWETQAMRAKTKSPSKGVQEIAKQLLMVDEKLGGAQFSKAELASLQRGREIYQELCFACHGPDGHGMPTEGATPGSTIAPPLAGSKDLLGENDAVIYILLHGLTGPIENKEYDAQMVSMASNDDKWLADIASYVRNAFGNQASMVSPAEVARLRKLTTGRTAPWTVAELKAVLPQPLHNAKSWHLSSSHNAQNAQLAADGDANTRWDSRKTQVAGMWFQAELPEITTITSLVLDAGKSSGDYPRGYKVELSTDGKTWGKPVATGKGVSAVTQIQFSPQPAKFIRITQTGTDKKLYWSIHELGIGTPGQKPELTKAKPAAASEFE